MPQIHYDWFDSKKKHVIKKQSFFSIGLIRLDEGFFTPRYIEQFRFTINNILYPKCTESRIISKNL